MIRAGLATFTSDAASAPGRFNVFDYRGATLIADYGHNPDAIAALTKAIEAIPAKRRSVVISGAGDRRDDDIRQQTEILGTAFDDVLLFQVEQEHATPAILLLFAADDRRDDELGYPVWSSHDEGRIRPAGP